MMDAPLGKLNRKRIHQPKPPKKPKSAKHERFLIQVKASRHYPIIQLTKLIDFMRVTWIRAEGMFLYANLIVLLQLLKMRQYFKISTHYVSLKNYFLNAIKQSTFLM